MKKITIAALFALISATASAQVTISGKVGQYVDSTKTGNTTVNSIATEPTSNIAIGAKENLGGGLTARVMVETSLSGNTINGTGTQLGDRQSTVGLSHKLGSIDLGRNVHSQFLAVTNNDAFNTLYGSVAGDVHNLRGLRFSNGAFASVSLAPGVTASYDHQQAGAGSTDARSYGISGKVAGLEGTVAYYEAGVEKSTVVGANYTLGATKLFYSHSDNESATAGETKKGDLVGLAHVTGPFTTKVSYGRTNKSTTAYSVGVDYAFSKRTYVGVAYRNVDVATANSDIKQIGVGLVHSF
jgi:predicted porin